MNSLKKVVVSYDLQTKRWAIETATYQALLHWGAQQVPLHVKKDQSERVHSPTKIYTSSYLKRKGDKLLLGPLIGIITVKKKGHYPFSGRKSNFIDLIRTARRIGAIVFVFTPEGIQWSKNVVKGYVYHPPLKQWKASLFPLPNVVYNRIPSREQERDPKVQKCLHQLQQTKGMYLFNPHFFYKEDLFKILQQSPSLQQVLPQTNTLNTRDDLETMLALHQDLYLKPTMGKAGQGIMKVQKRPEEESFILQVQDNNNPKKIQTKNIKRLWYYIRKYNIASPYIIQQGIQLTTIEQCPFDFRVLVQKNGKGEWSPTGLGIRVAGVDRITTHVPCGGRIETPKRVLEHIFSEEKSERLQQKVKKLAIAIAQELEKHYSVLGEMSMDIGLDKHERFWFFEANSKPMKFDEPHIRKRSLTNIIRFAQYLTFEKDKGDSDHEYLKDKQSSI